MTRRPFRYCISSLDRLLEISPIVINLCRKSPCWRIKWLPRVSLCRSSTRAPVQAVGLRPASMSSTKMLPSTTSTTTSISSRRVEIARMWNHIWSVSNRKGKIGYVPTTSKYARLTARTYWRITTSVKKLSIATNKSISRTKPALQPLYNIQICKPWSQPLL